MPDYIYLLENRFSADQRHALSQLREAARQAGTILFLTGDAVRDLTSGHAVRELEVAIHGNALKLKKSLEKLGGKVWGEDEASRSLYLCFPGTVRVDVISTHRVEYPKPGKPVFYPASIQEDLRRRDFTANSMAISLNEGSFGLLMDPLNGAADIESRTLRLVSNYGFIEEPELLIRATRYRARLAWEMDPRTLTRYENAKSERAIEALSAHARSQELEQIGHEEDGLKVLQALEDEGWMKVLYPAWTPAKADQEKLKALHELAVELLVQGVHADMSAAQMQLLTAKLPSKDLNALKKLMLRPGFVEEWNSLDALAAGFAKVLLAKQNAAPSASFKLFTSYDPEAVLWLGFTSTNAAVRERYNLFLKVWPEARQRIPYALLQEMRITPELPGYGELLHALFLKLIDERLGTPEEMRAYLEPHSPPAPPPQIAIKRSRARRGAEARLKERAFDEDEESEEPRGGDEELDDIGGDDEELELGLGVPRGGDEEAGEDGEEELESETESEPEPAVKVSAKKDSGTAGKQPKVPAQTTAEKLTEKSGKTGKVPAAQQPIEKAKPAAPAKKVDSEAKPKTAGKSQPVKPKPPAEKHAAHNAPPSKGGKAAGSGKVQSKQGAKPAAKTSTKSHAKSVPAKPAVKGKPGHGTSAKSGKAAPVKHTKPAAKKPAAKHAKKR